MIERLEPVLLDAGPDLVLVPGDVNSTLAGALTAAKLGIPVGHIESGLRSFDRTMPEELNRIVADQLSDHLFLHSEEAAGNLANEGIADERMHFVGNTMIDTLIRLEDRFRGAGTAAGLGVEPGGYLLVTLHRPALVDGPLLEEAITRLAEIAGADAGGLPAPPANPEDAGRHRVRRQRPAPHRPGRIPGLPLARGRRGRGPDRFRAASRRRRPTSASPASRCATTPSGR